VMAEEETLRARFVAARTRRDEAFEAWQDELLRDPPEGE